MPEVPKRSTGSALVADAAQELARAPASPLSSSTPFGGGAVHHAHHAAALLGRGHERLDRAGGGAEHLADLGALLDRVQQVDGIGTAQQQDGTRGPPPMRSALAAAALDQLGVVALGADQARARSLAEGEAELRARDTVVTTISARGPRPS